MLIIRYAEGLIEKLHYSNYEDYKTYPDSVFTCDKCGYKVRFAYKDLEKHRFLKVSNLTGQDKIMADRLILSMIPNYKIKQQRQIWALTKGDRLIVMLQRLKLRIIGMRGKFLPIPLAKENIPDSFIDYSCPQCKAPIRIYYSSYMGGRHCEMGFGIKYIIN
jgi:hypothetical protein